MRWFEVALQILGIFLVGNGLVQWFGWLRIEREAAVATALDQRAPASRRRRRPAAHGRAVTHHAVASTANRPVGRTPMQCCRNACLCASSRWAT